MTSLHIVLPTVLYILVIIAAGLQLSECRNFNIVNDCKETIWPGITPNDNFSGFELKPGQSAIFTPSDTWGGRIWARTGCNFDKDSNGTCQTGSCGSSLKCGGPGEPPASIAEFTLGELDYYDVSLVDGFNLPLVVTPLNGKGNCSAAGCDSDLRVNCPSELAFKPNGKIIACRSACNVFNTDEYCCRGMYSNPITCLPTNYSKSFKAACPAAYSYAHDDPTSILTCSATDYVVTFCSSRNKTACTYHDNQLVCNGSEGLMDFPQRLWILVLAFFMMISLPITF
ncbi:pathogenesis-related thaumatin-like protein 3.5 [Cornus florida]|uniref:pathogenesis-related thaumatin-like protein 3.5 n=1 Tax=Cornus florida TaxID=4283 RepID=UPI0028993096|nr:pathogenesis-related thaumatin-like protein 3.5 [Cornus florida]